MASAEHVTQLAKGVEVWNDWRGKNPDIRVDLGRADLTRADLSRANLRGADLRDANLDKVNLRMALLSEANLSEALLSEANLGGADLGGADLREANLDKVNLRGADLREADLREANLRDADLGGADLRGADLGGADLRGADLFQVRLYETVFGDTNLAGAIGLEECNHRGPSILDHRTLQKSGPLPLAFLRGIGLPDTLIEYLPSLLNQPIQFYSCFISYSATDQEFAERLYADLQNNHVRCWFAPHDMPIGGKILDTIDEAIRLRDKVLLILSESAIASDWVEDEVSKAFAEERDRKQTVLFPIRIDDTVMHTEEAWARKLRDQRNIGDFRRWKDHDSYRKSLERVLRNLKITQKQAPRAKAVP